MPPASALRDPRLAGGLLCAAGVVLLFGPGTLSTALAVEGLAMAFWWWARSSEDPERQIARWAWLRRPAAALWLAFAIEAAMPELARQDGSLRPGLETWRALDAAAIAWASLELLAALPLARTFSDLPGPLVGARPWLPVLLPVAGFAVLWRHAPTWTAAPTVRTAAAALLLATALLAAVRAYGRPRWTGSLRWLVVCDGALAGLLVATGAVPPPVCLLLWIGACGAHSFLLASELRGAAARRGAARTALWRATTWTAVFALAWPMLVDLAPRGGDPSRGAAFAAAAIPVVLACWVTVGRMIEAPERRAVTRRDAARTLLHVGPLFVFAGVPVSLVSAMWADRASPPWPAIVAALPAIAGGAIGLASLQADGRPEPRWSRTAERVAQQGRTGARGLFRGFVGFERIATLVLTRVVLAAVSPLRDLHTGDAQEYLLFLVGVGVLAIVLPLLR